MKLLKNKRGFAYIYVCVIIIFIAALLSVVIMYMRLMGQVQVQKRDAQQKLDGYVSEYATEAFDAIKQGEHYADHIDYTDFANGVYRAFGFTEGTMSVYEYPNGYCSMTRPTVTVLKGDGFGLTIRYTVIFPISWNGKTYSNLEIPLTVSSYYKFK